MANDTHNTNKLILVLTVTSLIVHNIFNIPISWLGNHPTHYMYGEKY